jgi:hypothetical protein
MAIRSFKTASISTGAKRSKFWDQSTVISYNSYESIATVTIGSPAANITFSSIPQTYVHLQVRAIMRADAAGASSGMYLFINGDSGANYSSHRIYANQSSVNYNSNAGATPPNSLGIGSGTGATSPANIFGANLIDILDYTNANKNTTIKSVNGSEQNNANDSYFLTNTYAWNNTAAVTSLQFTSNGTAFSTGTTFALYGLKNS